MGNITLTADDEVHVGIDVHKIKYYIAIWLLLRPAAHHSSAKHYVINSPIPDLHILPFRYTDSQSLVAACYRHQSTS